MVFGSGGTEELAFGAHKGANKMLFIINGQEHDIDVNKLPAESVAFLLEYGIKQYLSDGAAVSLRDKNGDLRPQEEVAAAKIEGVRLRKQNILEANFARRVVVPKKTREERVREDIIMERLREAASKSRTKLPTKKDNPEALQRMINTYYERYKDRVDTLVFAMLEDMEEVDLTDILG